MTSRQRVIVHVDMDAFYASVEQRDTPALRGKPIIVGGHPTRGVVLAASYEARKLGIQSAMPMARAMRIAPGAIAVSPRFNAYMAASEEVFRIFESVTPEIEALSLDEAFLDVTASLSLFGTAQAIATKVRKRILDEVGLPASAGIAEVKLVAKIASDLAKPNGQLEVLPGTAQAFLAPLPVWRLWGVGPKTLAHLARESVRTIGDLTNRSPEWLRRHLGASGLRLRQLGLGEDVRPVATDRQVKSIGAQETFPQDVTDLGALQVAVHQHALKVGRRLRACRLRGRTVQLTLKFSDFRQVTRQCSLEPSTDDGQAIYRAVRRLLENHPRPQPIRLTGVAVSNFSPDRGPADLFAFKAESAENRINATLDRITHRFGHAAISTADVHATGRFDRATDGFYIEERRQSAARAETARGDLERAGRLEEES